jgi:hypothetical protein
MRSPSKHKRSGVLRVGTDNLRHWLTLTPTGNKNPKPRLVLWDGFRIFIPSRLVFGVDTPSAMMLTAVMKLITCIVCRKKFKARNNVEAGRGKGTCRPKCHEENRRRLQIKRRLTGTQASIKVKPRSTVRQSAVRKGRKTHNGRGTRKVPRLLPDRKQFPVGHWFETHGPH